MKEFIIAFFELSKKERRGIIVLILLIFLLLSYRVGLRYFQSPIIINKSIYYALIDSLKQVESKRNQVSPINPNTANYRELVSIGLSSKQANMILSYIKKGHRFRVRNDLNKIYSISDQDFQKIQPYIDLPTSSTASTNNRENKYPENNNGYVKDKATKTISNKLNLNTVDSTLLVTLKGIGPILAKRIIKYRNSLGGFNNIDQLTEIYGITDSLYQALQPRLHLDNNFRRIYINRIESSSGFYHPYLKAKQLQIIINYRQQHGVFKNHLDIKQSLAISDSLLNRLKPYLSFEP